MHDANLCLCTTCERKRVCYDALAGIADPAAFMEAVRELCDGIEVMGINNVGHNVMTLKDKIIAMLPENADAK